MIKSAEIAYLADLVLTQAGQTLGPDAATTAVQKLASLARREGLGDSLELLRLAQSQNSPALMSAIVDAIMPNDTRFFRDRPLWKALREEVLPNVMKAHGAQSSPMRIWSAGCGFGQESYSFSMAVADKSEAMNCPVEIVGTDISERAIERARSGIYTQFEVQRGLSIHLLLRHFEREGEHWRIDNPTRRRTRFARHNLLLDFAPLGAFDIISCQNVLTNFTPERRDNVLGRILAQLKPGGVLMVGEGEGAWLRPFSAHMDVLYAPSVFRRKTAQRQVA